MKTKGKRQLAKNNRKGGKSRRNPTRISSESRVVKKITNSKNKPARRALKRSDKMKKYSLKALNDYFENKFNVSVDTEH